MSTPRGRPQPRTGVVLTATALGIIESALLVLAMGFLGFLVFSSVAGRSSDPHGYTMIFGTMAAVVLALPTALFITAAVLTWRLRPAGFLMLAILNVMGAALTLWGLFTSLTPLAGDYGRPGGVQDLPLVALLGPALLQGGVLALSVLTAVLAFKSYNALHKGVSPPVQHSSATWR